MRRALRRTVVATIDQQGYMLIVDGKSPYPDVAALTAAMRSKGDKASYLTTSHTGRVMGELYKASATVALPGETSSTTIWMPCRPR